MAFKIINRQLNGLILIEPDVFTDDRGFFLESFKKSDFAEIGINVDFVQENHSLSTKGVIRGMHFQWDPPQGKLIRVTRGEAMVAEVDIRKNSPHFGKSASFILSAENKHILWVPAGFANGFAVISEFCEMQYKCTSYWNKAGEAGILWNDPAIGIDWQIENPILSEKDKSAMTLEDWSKSPFSSKLSL